MSSLEGKHALVAGGSVRQLPAIRALVHAGADVLIQAQTPEDIETAQKAAAEHQGRVRIDMRPVTTFAEAAALVDELIAERGSIDVLLTPVVPEAPGLTDLTEATWAAFKATYLTRAVALTRSATAAMVGQPEGGRVIVFSSAATFASTGAAQAAANAALLSLTSAASAGLRETDVRVNALLLGTPTAARDGAPAPSGDVDMLGPATTWLAGPESGPVNGRYVYVSGSDVGFYTMPMLMENANARVRFDREADAATVGRLLNDLVDIGKVQRQA